MKRTLRKLVRALGYEVYRYPEATERLLPHIKRLMSTHGGDTVIDVGANVGQFASDVRALGKDIWIHSVEPNPVVYKILLKNAQRDDRWITYERALGRESGRVNLHIYKDSDFSSCLLANDFGNSRFHDSLTPNGLVEVKLVSLDELLTSIPPESIGKKILLKLDTQGFDMEVLLGADNVLNTAFAVVAEASLRPIYEGAVLFPELLVFMQEKGFVLSGFFPVSRASDLSIIESDCVFVRPSSC